MSRSSIAEMAEAQPSSGFLPSMKTAMRLCLAVQVGLAGVLMSEDAFSWLQSVREPGIRYEQTAPVEPGDQTRPFTRVSVPVLKDPTKRLNAPVRLPETMDRELTFAIQDTEDYGRVVLVSGGINDQDSGRFESFLRDVDPPAKYVALHSPGGAVHEALKIGRTIRESGLNTMISPDAACLSACPYILAGGVERIVSRSGWVGLHQHFHDRNTIIPSFLAVESVQAGHGETLEYLSDMEIDPLVLLHILKTPPEDIYLLVEQELTDYRLATEMID